MLRIWVLAGARAGARDGYLAGARELGREIARLGYGMVYGGAARGLMGACADAALAGGAEVVGVLPRALAAREIAHPGLTEMRIVGSLHERKAVMSALSDAVIALPGGCGTMDELFEAITWAQLGLHQKPIGIFDVEGYYQPLLQLLDHLTREGFVHPPLRLVHDSSAAALLDRLLTAPPAASGNGSPPPPP